MVASLDNSVLEKLIEELSATVPELTVLPASPRTVDYAYDAATAPRTVDRDQTELPSGPAVAFPVTPHDVQQVVRAAARHNVEIVPRGAGTGLAGGASAAREQLVVSTEKLDKVTEISPLDELAVVQPGVINADLNKALAPYGLFYAPDPASWEISSIGGNIATNAGGLRCVKYGVTRESILALDVVLPDGNLVTLGQRSIKGVAGLDLRALVIGSEGTLGIVVSATVKVHPIPVARRTVTAFFPDTLSGARGLEAVTTSGVRPSIAEFVDGPTLADIDRASGSDLSSRGGSLILIEIDGYGIDEQFADLAAALQDAGAVVTAEDAGSAEQLWQLRRSGRSGHRSTEWTVGGDIAVPRSRIVDIFALLPQLEQKYGVTASGLAHAGDGNVHPRLSIPIPPGADPAVPDPRLRQAELELTRFAISVGGTITAEHGIGSKRRDLLSLELDERVIVLNNAVKDAFDPTGTLNPGKAF
jgi:glycolate oxidase